MGVARRRHFQTHGRLIGLDDESSTGRHRPATSGLTVVGEGRPALLAALTAPRGLGRCATSSRPSRPSRTR